MSYLVAADVLPLAGYPEDVAKASEALEFAEEIISGFTGLSFAAISDEVKPYHLTAKTYELRLARDVTAVTSISPNANGYTLSFNVDHFGNKTLTWANASGERQVFDEGFYTITQNRQATLEQRINKAASLLAAYWLGMSDPDRSRYASFSQGDVSGSMRLDDTPVPEATALLRWYIPRGRAALV